jgi:4a-hydroxytetrahydrobiopterin dehydratase
MERLGDDRIESALAGSGWRRDGNAITREWELRDFAAAMEMAGRVGDLAEKANHHPDILVHGWNRLRLILSTHSAGGITEADLALAKKIEDLS